MSTGRWPRRSPIAPAASCETSDPTKRAVKIAPRAARSADVLRARSGNAGPRVDWKSPAANSVPPDTTKARRCVGPIGSRRVTDGLPARRSMGSYVPSRRLSRRSAVNATWSKVTEQLSPVGDWASKPSSGSGRPPRTKYLTKRQVTPSVDAWNA